MISRHFLESAKKQSILFFLTKKSELKVRFLKKDEFAECTGYAKNIVSLGMALMVRKVGKGKGFFRTVFFFPNLLGGLAMGFIWSFIFQNVYSLMLFGEDSPIHIPFLCDMLLPDSSGL